MTSTSEAAERVFREEYASAFASLVRTFGDFDTAAEAIQEAFVVAVDRWPSAGLPDNPAAWITTAASHSMNPSTSSRQAQCRLSAGSDPELSEEGSGEGRATFGLTTPGSSPRHIGVQNDILCRVFRKAERATAGQGSYTHSLENGLTLKL